LFPIPLTSVSAAVLFAEAIGIVDDCTTIVAPDEGGRVRCELLNRALECGRPVIYCRKVRTAKSVTSELVGVPTERAIVYDDILDTGDTLVACCERLVEAGAKRISVFATHGLFTGSNWHRLWELNVERITCTDSVPGSLPPDARIFSIDCAPTLSAALESVADPKEFAHV
jgi:ribose-phosphate pyrophosphokinase